MSNYKTVKRKTVPFHSRDSIILSLLVLPSLKIVWAFCLWRSFQIYPLLPADSGIPASVSFLSHDPSCVLGNGRYGANVMLRAGSDSKKEERRTSGSSIFLYQEHSREQLFMPLNPSSPCA